MAITNTDIVLFQSQDNTDNENGGGSRSSVPVADGAVNNLFPDISRIDTVSGDVALRKVFPVVNSDNREIYYGAHAMIRKVPEDPRVSALLFYTDDPTDTRDSAQSDVESYLIPSFQAPFYLYGSNIEGAKAVTFLQRREENVPDVGEVFVIQEGSNVQYIRFASIDATDVKIFFNNTDYERRRVIATIEQALLFTFTGSTFNPAGQNANTADTFATQIADAARFYGNKGLADDALQGATSIETTGIFEQLVPASTQQSAILNKKALTTTAFLYNDSSALLNGIFFNLWSPAPLLILSTPIQPGTVEWGNYTDNGEGRLVSNSNEENYNIIDYEAGTISWFNATMINSSFRYKSAISLETVISNSSGIQIISENQGNVYIQNVAPVPTASSAYVDYRSGGKWYRLNGNSDGTIGSGDGLGVGIILDNGDGTATISVTLGALPDINSTIIFAWGSADALSKVADQVADDAEVWFEWKLPHENINPNDFSLTYDGGYSMTISTINFTDASSEVEMPYAQATFKLDALAGIVYMRQTNSSSILNTPLSGGSTTTPDDYIDCTYTYAATPGAGDDGERLVIFNADFSSNTELVYNYAIGTSVDISDVILTVGGIMGGGFTSRTFAIVLTSDKNGIFREGNTNTAWGTVSPSGVIEITVPVSTRSSLTRVTLNGNDFSQYVNANKPKYRFSTIQSIEYSTAPISTFPLSANSKVLHETECYINIQLAPFAISNFKFSLWDRDLSGTSYVYTVLANGDILEDGDPTHYLGNYDKDTGIARMNWGNPELDIANYNYNMNSGVNIGDLYVDSDQNGFDGLRQVFRAGASDLVTSSFILRYATKNGTFVATTNQNGLFSGTDINVTDSYVDTITGAVFLIFTEDANPDSIFFDAVATTTLPLDPELLGLNPVRLPPDGRVPIFYPGAFIVIFQEDATSAGTPTANQVVTLGRSGQSYIEVVDVNGQRLAYDQYVADRDAGTVTFANGLLLIDRQGDSLTTPMTIIDRVEDMALCTDTSVTGRINISSPLSRDYTAGQARVASALVWGDIGSRVFNMFSESSFSIWSNERTNNVISSQFDNVNYPIQINNKDSFTGRWALVFTNNSQVDVISEKLGILIEDAPINADISPINPATGLPYFTIPTDGWGGGWVTSNSLRFNTTSGAENMWIIRTVQSGALTEQIDSIEVEIRGDAN